MHLENNHHHCQKNMRNERHIHQWPSTDDVPALLTCITHIHRFALQIQTSQSPNMVASQCTCHARRYCANAFMNGPNFLCYVYQISCPNSPVGSLLLRNVRLPLGAGTDPQPQQPAHLQALTDTIVTQLLSWWTSNGTGAIPDLSGDASIHHDVHTIPTATHCCRRILEPTGQRALFRQSRAHLILVLMALQEKQNTLLNRPSKSTVTLSTFMTSRFPFFRSPSQLLQNDHMGRDAKKKMSSLLTLEQLLVWQTPLQNMIIVTPQSVSGEKSASHHQT